MSKAKLRHPPHILLDDTWYMITSSTYQRHRFLVKEGQKDFLWDQLKAIVTKFNLKMAAWVILDNHYHVLIKSKLGVALPKALGQLHGLVSFELNKRDNVRGRQLWHNYWDTGIRTETDYWVRFNYIHHNPIKHGYAQRMEDWRFSSYGWYLNNKGADWIADAFQRYPIVDFSDTRDSF